jgi:hypothetical protein
MHSFLGIEKFSHHLTYPYHGMVIEFFGHHPTHPHHLMMIKKISKKFQSLVDGASVLDCDQKNSVTI